MDCETSLGPGAQHSSGDRWAALEPIRQGVRTHLRGYARKITLGLGLRHDWAPQYTAHQFAAELRWLGIRPTPWYVGDPQCNGIMERFLRTLKEECLYVHEFRNLEEARAIICEQHPVAPRTARSQDPGRDPSGAHSAGGMIKRSHCPIQRVLYTGGLDDHNKSQA